MMGAPGRFFRACALVTLSGVVFGCAPRSTPPALSQAEAVSESKAAKEAENYAPQAFAAAEKLRAEAHFLLKDGREEEAVAASEQAIAAYSLAFSLSRVARAEERQKAATKTRNEAQKKLAELDQLHASVAQDADTFELRARIHLDTEKVSDVDSVTPARAKARRLAAARFSAEAGLLCLGARLLGAKSKELEEIEASQSRLDAELKAGSEKGDLYPRASDSRAACLAQLTGARRPAHNAHPESAEADQLLSALTETGTLFAYRDDRGIVVQLGAPLDKEGTLTDAAKRSLTLLGGTARAHANFPIIVVPHTKKSGEEARSAQIGDSVALVLKESGAKNVTVYPVYAAQPLVSTQISGAAERNERVEIVFVTQGR